MGPTSVTSAENRYSHRIMVPIIVGSESKEVISFELISIASTERLQPSFRHLPSCKEETTREKSFACASRQPGVETSKWLFTVPPKQIDSQFSGYEPSPTRGNYWKGSMATSLLSALAAVSKIYFARYVYQFVEPSQSCLSSNHELFIFAA